MLDNIYKNVYKKFEFLFKSIATLFILFMPTNNKVPKILMICIYVQDAKIL